LGEVSSSFPVEKRKEDENGGPEESVPRDVLQDSLLQPKDLQNGSSSMVCGLPSMVCGSSSIM
jgi:hypothetical protein